MPSVSLSKENYDRMVILVGSKKVNDFVNEVVNKALKEAEKVG